MRLRVLFALLLSFSLWAGTQAAYAGAAWTNVKVLLVSPCTPNEPGCNPNGFVEVEFTADSSGGASCGGNKRNWAVIDVTTAAGQAAFTVIQAARIYGLTISVYGTGNCEVYPTIETLGTLNE